MSRNACSSSAGSIAREGVSAWRIVTASRAAVLIDGAAYFETIAEGVRRAQERVFILGWDIHSRTLLQRRKDGEGLELRELLRQALDRRRSLHVYILVWDFAMIFALERDWTPLFDPAWSRHPRLHFSMDDHHPVGACHHQKVVVIDDALGFAGGLDLTKRRWDTPEHLPEDPRRVDPTNAAYRPFHDVQMVVEGQAAHALGELARERWRAATGETLDPVAGAGLGPWPPELEPDMRNVEVAISRTLPRYKGRDEVREIEALYSDAIASAQRYIYMETQYFTSSVIRSALEERLGDARGPEVVLVLPLRCTGWLEESTMGQLRARVLSRLRELDVHERLSIYWPMVSDSVRRDVFVHAKVLLIDDRFLRIGSSNASNRSLGLDTECDLSVEWRGREDIACAIRAALHRLLAEHLGTSPQTVADRLEAEGSLRAAVEALRNPEKSLEPLEVLRAKEDEVLASFPSLVDPERPIDPEDLLVELAPEEPELSRGRGVRNFAGVLVVLLTLAAVWRWTSLHDFLEIDTLTGFVGSVAESPFAPLVVVGFYIVASLLMVPVTVQIVATALAFGPFTAAFYAAMGTLASAAVTYGIGHALGRQTVRKLSGSRLNRLSRQLARRGFLTTLATRILPVAPFTIINLVAGASHIRFRDFVLASFLGMLPGIIAITVLEARIEDLIRRPGGTTIALLLGAATAVAAGWWWLRRRLLDERPA